MSKKNKKSNVEKVSTLKDSAVESEVSTSQTTEASVEKKAEKTASQLLREQTKDVFTLFILFVQDFFRKLETAKRNGESIESKIFALLEIWTKEQAINFTGRKGTGFFGKHFFGVHEGGKEVNADVFYNFLNKEVFAVENSLQKGFVASVSRIGFAYFDVQDAEAIKGRNVRGEIWLRAYNEIEIEAQRQKEIADAMKAKEEKKEIAPSEQTSEQVN